MRCLFKGRTNHRQSPSLKGLGRKPVVETKGTWLKLSYQDYGTTPAKAKNNTPSTGATRSLLQLLEIFLQQRGSIFRLGHGETRKVQGLNHSLGKEAPGVFFLVVTCLGLGLTETNGKLSSLVHSFETHPYPLYKYTPNWGCVHVPPHSMWGSYVMFAKEDTYFESHW